MNSSVAHLDNLSSFRKFTAGLPTSWAAFLRQRQLRLAQQQRNGTAAEKVAENIVEDLFTIALDWDVSAINNQLEYADIVLTMQGIKRLLIEVKRPGLLGWDRPSLEKALGQARRYADEQRVRTIAVSDGTLFYAMDIMHGGLRERVRLLLDAPTHSPDLWWLSMDGIYRPAMRIAEQQTTAEAQQHQRDGKIQPEPPDPLLHRKYKLPAACFAYVGNASKPSTWKLPYRKADGTPDEARLPAAIRAVVTNYRGVRVKSIPESATPDVLVCLARAAAEIRQLPGQTPSPIESYQQLYDALHQLGRLDEVPI